MAEERWCMYFRYMYEMSVGTKAAKGLVSNGRVKCVCGKWFVCVAGLLRPRAHGMYCYERLLRCDAGGGFVNHVERSAACYNAMAEPSVDGDFHPAGDGASVGTGTVGTELETCPTCGLMFEAGSQREHNATKGHKEAARALRLERAAERDDPDVVFLVRGAGAPAAAAPAAVAGGGAAAARPGVAGGAGAAGGAGPGGGAGGADADNGPVAMDLGDGFGGDDPDDPDADDLVALLGAVGRRRRDGYQIDNPEFDEEDLAVNREERQDAPTDDEDDDTRAAADEELASDGQSDDGGGAAADGAERERHAIEIVHLQPPSMPITPVIFEHLAYSELGNMSAALATSLLETFRKWVDPAHLHELEQIATSYLRACVTETLLFDRFGNIRPTPITIEIFGGGGATASCSIQMLDSVVPWLSHCIASAALHIAMEPTGERGQYAGSPHFQDLYNETVAAVRAQFGTDDCLVLPLSAWFDAVRAGRRNCHDKLTPLVVSVASQHSSKSMGAFRTSCVACFVPDLESFQPYEGIESMRNPAEALMRRRVTQATVLAAWRRYDWTAFRMADGRLVVVRMAFAFGDAPALDALAGLAYQCLSPCPLCKTEDVLSAVAADPRESILEVDEAEALQQDTGNVFVRHVGGTLDDRMFVCDPLHLLYLGIAPAFVGLLLGLKWRALHAYMLQCPGLPSETGIIIPKPKSEVALRKGLSSFSASLFRGFCVVLVHFLEAPSDVTGVDGNVRDAVCGALTLIQDIYAVWMRPTHNDEAMEYLDGAVAALSALMVERLVTRRIKVHYLMHHLMPQLRRLGSGHVTHGGPLEYRHWQNVKKPVSRTSRRGIRVRWERRLMRRGQMTDLVQFPGAVPEHVLQTLFARPAIEVAPAGMPHVAVESAPTFTAAAAIVFNEGGPWDALDTTPAAAFRDALEAHGLTRGRVSVRQSAMVGSPLHTIRATANYQDVGPKYDAFAYCGDNGTVFFIAMMCCEVDFGGFLRQCVWALQLEDLRRGGAAAGSVDFMRSPWSDAIQIGLPRRPTTHLFVNDLARFRLVQLMPLPPKAKTRREWKQHFQLAYEGVALRPLE